MSFHPDLINAPKNNIYYNLVMFPYPSGYGLHAGHASNYTITDVNARYHRMLGRTVFNPIGFDSFGLPSENYAMKMGKPAYEVTADNIAMFTKQMKALNMSFDYDRMVTTSQPDYYKRTQRIFAKLYEHGLVYRDNLYVNWCPDCQTVLANDQVVDGKCERCKYEIIQKKHPQRFIKITDYADRLLEDLDLIDRPEETKTTQRNRIGRSEGAEIDFPVSPLTGDDEGVVLVAFTTRPDTIYGVTALVLAPENTQLDDLVPVAQKQEVEAYRQQALAKTAVQRQKDAKDKTGVFSGLYATHPLTDEPLPVWFADYVLADYGTGVVMIVPAHDQRDRDFATKFDLPIIDVIVPLFESEFKRQTDKQIVERQMASAIVKHWSEDKYLCLDWHKLGWKSFPMGGIEDGEDAVDAIKREIEEETGYQDAKFIKQVGGYIHSKYYAGHKDQNRYSKERCFYFELQSGQCIEAQDVEQHSFHWVEAKKVEARLANVKGKNGHNHFWNCFQGTNKLVLAGELINSEGFDGLGHKEAQIAIIDELEKQGKGRKQITYKLRDRSVSRQRYWGSPIPMYYDCADNEQVPFFPAQNSKYELKPDMPMVLRVNALMIIKHWSEDKFLCIKRNNKHIQGDVCFPTGGVEEGEAVVATAMREVKEETGYQNVRLIAQVPQEIHTAYYADHKQTNRYGVQHGVVLQLENDEQCEQQLEDHDQFDLVRVDHADIMSTITYNNHKHLRAQHFAPDQLPDCEYTQKYNPYHPHPDKNKRIPTLIPYDELPVQLPLDIANYKPKGKSPLADHPTFPYYTPKQSHKSSHLTVLLIHGRGNSSTNGGCLMGVQKTLEVQGATVIFPDLTYHQDYDFDQAMETLLQYDADIVVGHSAGGYLACHYAAKKKTSHLIAIAPTSPSAYFDEQFNQQTMDWLGKENATKYNTFHDTAWEQISLSQTNCQFFFGEQDPNIPSSMQQWYQTTHTTAKTTVLPDQGHMGSKGGVVSVDAVDEYIKSLCQSTPSSDHPQSSEVYLRECDTLDTFMCSSFYFLRYPDANNPDELISKELRDKMFPVDFYCGGKEHSVGHLLYSRFIHKFLYDIGYVSSPEPFAKLVHQGMVLGPDGRKMSKRRGNVIDPLDVIEKYDADTLRTYLMFMGPVEQDKAWNDKSLHGIYKFLQKIKKLTDKGDQYASEDFLMIAPDQQDKHMQAVITMTHKTIKGVTYDMDRMKYNTCISKIMILYNTINEHGVATKQTLEALALMLAPFATELASYLRAKLGHEDDIHFAPRPSFDESKIASEAIKLPIQINGKMRGTVEVEPDTDQETVMSLLPNHPNIHKYIDGKELKKIIFVANKIINIIV